MGLGRGWACVGIQFNYSKWGRVGPGGLGPSIGPVRAEWGLHWDSIKFHYSKTRPWLQIGQFGCRVWPVRAEWGWGGSGVGEGLGTHRIGQVGPVRFEWGRVGPSRAG